MVKREQPNGPPRAAACRKKAVEATLRAAGYDWDMTSDKAKFKWSFSMFAPLMRSYMESNATWGHMWKIKPLIFHVNSFNAVIYGKSVHAIR